MRKLASGLSSHSPSPDRVRAPRPARGAPFTIHRHIIVASIAMRSATPRFMEMAGGAGKTFSSLPAGIADRVKRVRLPAIEDLLRGKGSVRSTRLRFSLVSLAHDFDPRRPASRRRASVRLSGHNRKNQRRGRTSVQTVLIHPPPDLPGQRRDEFQSGSFRVRLRNPPAIIRHHQTSLAIAHPRNQLDTEKSASGPNGGEAVGVTTSVQNETERDGAIDRQFQSHPPAHRCRHPRLAA